MAVFLILAFVGVAVLLMSALFGGDHDLSAEHELHFEHGYEAAAGADHEMGGGPSPFSLRIISLFVTAFGAVGAIVRYNGASYVLSSISGLGGGFLIGAIGFQIMKLFYKQQATSTVSMDDLINSAGEVKIAIPGTGVGQICVEVKNQLRYFPARSKDGKEIEEGATVKITSCPGGGAVIVERQ
jgi:hypothetical protein